MIEKEIRKKDHEICPKCGQARVRLPDEKY